MQRAQYHYSDYSTGLSMLVPEPWDDHWTKLADGVFNAKPDALAPSTAAGVSPNSNAVSTNTTAITAATPNDKAILTANPNRRLLIIQNASTATAAGDEAPTFFVAFGQNAQQFGSLFLPPGVGIVLDYACPIDSVYVAIGPFSNGGDSVVISGAVIEGVRPPSVPGS